jgi:effector-binding domain-containing protein
MINTLFPPKKLGRAAYARLLLAYQLVSAMPLSICRHASVLSVPMVMKLSEQIILAIAVITGSVNIMAIEESSYTLTVQEDKFEIRDYAPQILAETVVEGTLEDAGSKAFNRLFRYISGENRPQGKIAMTAPVTQQPQGEKINMTSPVGQQQVEGQWAVSFTMPASYSLESLPKPEDATVKLRQVPARRMAAVRYSGFWSEKNYQQNKMELESWIQKKGLTILGDAVWARYNPPFTPWFMRRNEILIPVEGGS